MNAILDVLIPTCNRPTALAVTLSGLVGNDDVEFSVYIADQSDGRAGYDDPTAQAVLRVLQARGHSTVCWRNLPRRGLAHQRQTLLERSCSNYVLFLDDDVLLEPGAINCMLSTIRRQRCGFVANAVIGLSYRHDVRTHEQAVEFWADRVEPEKVIPGSTAWARHLLHNGANLWHVQRVLDADRAAPLLYKLAWAGGCVLYDRMKLVACGGFDFWTELPPEHCGEDVLAQMRVMARFGGCGIMPSGAFHLELPTTVSARHYDAPWLLAHSAATTSK